MVYYLWWEEFRYLGKNRDSVLHQTFVLDQSSSVRVSTIFQPRGSFIFHRPTFTDEQYNSGPCFPLKRIFNYLKRTKSSHFPKVVRKTSFVYTADFHDASVFSLSWKFCLTDTFHSTFNPENLIDSVDMTNTEGLPGLKLQGDNWGGKESVTKWKCGFIKTSSLLLFFASERNVSSKLGFIRLTKGAPPARCLFLQMCKSSWIREYIHQRTEDFWPRMFGKTISNF